MKTYPAIALIELNNLATGIKAGDAMAKKSPIAILKTGTVSKGKFLILIAGTVAAVDEAYTTGIAVAGSDRIDSMILPDAHPRVVEALLEKKTLLKAEALGIIETEAIATNIQAADAAIKGARVDIIEMRMGDGYDGKGYTLFNGKVEDVESAIDIATLIIAQKNVTANSTIIPSLNEGMAKQINANLRFNKSLQTQLRDGEKDVAG
ncbi:MAG: BMC domain-containing protein [Calditrichia bacterium]